MGKWSGKGQPNTRRKLHRLRSQRAKIREGERSSSRLARKWTWHAREMDRMLEGCELDEG